MRMVKPLNLCLKSEWGTFLTVLFLPLITFHHIGLGTLTHHQLVSWYRHQTVKVTHTHTQPNMHERQRTHTQPITCQQHLNELNSCLFSILCVESGHKAQLWQCTQRHLFSFLISTLYFKCILVLSVTLFTTTNIDRSWNGKNRSRSLARSYDNGFNPLIYCKKY